MRNTKQTPKCWTVVFYDGKTELESARWTCTKNELWTRLKSWLAEAKSTYDGPRFEFTEVVHQKPITSLFLDKEKRKSILDLQKSIKDKYRTYPEGDVKRLRLKNLAIDMWNSIQNEFYMTANICDNTVWHWQDAIADFDEFGYLYDREPTELTDWTKLLSGWYHREWAIEVLKFVKDFNLDNQSSEYVTAFQNDFKKVKDEKQLCSVLLKWNDLVYWSPWKLSLLDNTFQQPINMHYEDEFNPDVEESDDMLD